MSTTERMGSTPYQATDFTEIEFSTVKGQLSKYDIQRELKSADGLKINPFIETCLKPASYDITPTCIAMSSKLGMLETVYREANYCGDRYFFYVHPKDTVLVISNEYIKMPPYMAGEVASRVSMVTKGFGHISTTIDPNWSGATLIALSNPSSQFLKVYLNDSKSPNQLATVTFHYLNSSCSKTDSDKNYLGMRLDLLEKVCFLNRTGFRATLRRIIHPYRKAFTNYFFHACETKYKDINEENWEKFVEEFSSMNAAAESNSPKCSRRAKKVAKDFVITENFVIRGFHFLIKHKISVSIFAVIGLILLEWTGVIPETIWQRVMSYLAMIVELVG